MTQFVFLAPPKHPEYNVQLMCERVHPCLHALVKPIHWLNNHGKSIGHHRPVQRHSIAICVPN